MVFLFIFSVLALIVTMRWLLRVTPKHLLTHGYEAVNEKVVEKEQEPGLFEGLKILVANNYLLGIFAAVAFLGYYGVLSFFFWLEKACVLVFLHLLYKV